MSRTRSESAVTTRNSRKGLEPRAKPYLRTIATGVSIGYRKKAKDGLWTASLYLGGGRYKEKVIGIADDVLDADGTTVLTFEQARKAALAKADQWRADEKVLAAGPVITVRTAVVAYAAAMGARASAQGITRRDCDNRLGLHVLSDPLADVGLHALTETMLSEWRMRRSAGRAESSIRRISNDLRAALNAAAKKYRATLPADLPTVIKIGLASESHDQPIARDDAALPDHEIRKLLDAAQDVDQEGGWDGDLHRLIVTLAATGARFSQVIRIRVGDLQIERGRIMIPVSRKGKGTKGSSHIPVRIGEDVIEVLTPATKGRKPSEPLLTRWRREQGSEGFAQWVRGERKPWTMASEIRRPWAEIVKKAGLPAETVPYSLRHSAVVRALKAGLPVRLVAALHDTSVAMIESHYSSSITSMLDDMAATAIIPLIGVKKKTAKVVPIRS